jgi:hypothetical protein
MRSLYLASAAVLFCLGATAAHATPFAGSFSVATLDLTALDSSNNPTTNLSNATSFEFGTSLVTGGANGNFAPFVGDTITFSTLTLNNLTTFSFTSAFGTFQADSLTYTPSLVPLVTNGEQSSETIYEYGTFTPVAGSGLDPDSLSLTFALTDTDSGSGNSLSVSGTAAAPAAAPPASVPEPITLSLLGMGLVGLGAVRRRKANATA